MKQLLLSKKELRQIGFKAKRYKGDELNAPSTVYEIPFINGVFYFNTTHSQYKWYQKVCIGDACNYINLYIPNKATLYNLLTIFNVKFNLIA